ncbi:hypothetical protein Kisp02_49520 [Kineosporia sp. NBRC 101731]|nr:hypothetical protein Kisp02_49520 [Kineosporia sp. NBRC 101731]
MAARVLEEKDEVVFHPDSYGYRPDRSAIDAVGQCRWRCDQDDKSRMTGDCRVRFCEGPGARFLLATGLTQLDCQR